MSLHMHIPYFLILHKKESCTKRIRAVAESVAPLNCALPIKLRYIWSKKWTQNRWSMRMFYILTSSPTLWHVPWSQKLWNGSRPSKVLIFERWILSDDWLMWYRHFINHEKFQVCDLDLKVRWDGILDQYLTSGIVSTRSIQRFKRYPILKTFNQKL